MELNDLTHTSGEWLRGSGPEADIVISSRIRLARNLADFPFISRATEQDRTQIENALRGQILRLEASGELLYVDVEELEGVDRQFLVERHLISREHAESHGARADAGPVAAVGGRSRECDLAGQEPPRTRHRARVGCDLR